LAGPDEERHAVPPPRVHEHADGRVRLDVGIGRDAALVAVAVELAAYQITWLERLHRSEHLLLLVPQGLHLVADGWLRGQDRRRLEHVVLDHVAQGADLLVEAAAAFDAEVLGHRDLDALDVVAVPDGLEERVREAEVQEVLDRLLTEIVVDAEDRGFRQHRMQDPVELLGRRQVAPEGLFDDDAGVIRAAGLAEPFDHGREQAGRDREVVRRALRLGVLQRRADRGERAGVPVVTVHVAHGLGELLERVLVVDATAVLLDAVVTSLAEVVDGPLRRRRPDHRDREMTALGKGVERGKDLLVGEVARCAEEDQRVRVLGSGVHHCPFSMWPPNSLRRAESSLSAKSASPRELNRSNSDAVMTCAGTLSSIAAMTVQRPSRRAERRPSTSATWGERWSASAVRSSSHDEITLPRRQTSATSGMFRSYW